MKKKKSTKALRKSAPGKSKTPAAKKSGKSARAAKPASKKTAGKQKRGKPVAEPEAKKASAKAVKQPLPARMPAAQSAKKKLATTPPAAVRKSASRGVQIVPKTVKKLIIKHSKKRVTGKPRIQDDEIWIMHDDGTYETVSLLPDGYTLRDGDTICCYNPDPSVPPTPEPEVEQFTVVYDDQSGQPPEPVIEYDYSNDTLEVDLSVIDQFEEDYDPNDDQSYDGSCEDPPVGIGISG